ncbi:Serine/threonine-protein kinase PCRK2 [Camellia lanceoleosa]|uniref:Serine/threonine-protein kinase PCRK2 n=1 Tax=Camellia lanceoleosa TaxID=1840588 RepID=A0ACC0HMI4_9ERIC|nr:Serine/threonine-protein kinase PCRK2 [Camellia lanceoleosa]
MRRSGSLFNSQNVSDTSTESVGRSQFLSLSQRSSNPKLFTYSELQMATENFNHTVKLGEGGFGCVYKGVVKSSEDPERKLDVAVKQLGKRGLQASCNAPLLTPAALWPENSIATRCAAPIGPQTTPPDATTNTPANTHLPPLPTPLQPTPPTPPNTDQPQDTGQHPSNSQPRRSARVHTGLECTPPAPTRQKRSNELLNSPAGSAKPVVGTIGYAAPEYIQTGRLTSKSDVWSYGVFLYELITGRRPLDHNRPKSEQKLLDWVKPHLSDSKKFQQILDPRLEWNDSKKSAQKLAIIANRCLGKNAKARPKMSEVLEMVNQLVEASQEIGRSSSQPPESSSMSRETSEETKVQGKQKPTGESGWLHWIWSSKLLRTC